MQLADIRLEVESTAGLETWIDLPELKLAVDLGRSPSRLIARARVLFTHSHLDHLAGLPHHCGSRALMGMDAPEYFVPPGESEAVHALLEAQRRLDRSELPCTVRELPPGERLSLHRGMQLETFKTWHNVPSQGFAFWSQSSKLKAEFQGRPSQELAELSKRGVELSDRTERLELAISGDTRIELLTREEQVRKARALLFECTFLDDRISIEKARHTGHTHLDEIVEHADLFENEVIGLYHFSARYSSAQIDALLDAKLPPGLRSRVVALHPPRS